MFSAYKLILFLLSIGTSIGGNDVVAFFDVGVVNHKAISGLTLHSGHSYYATVKGIYNHCIFNSRIMNFENTFIDINWVCNVCKKKQKVKIVFKQTCK